MGRILMEWPWVEVLNVKGRVGAKEKTRKRGGSHPSTCFTVLGPGLLLE
jgi:hypothetical protein